MTTKRLGSRYGKKVRDKLRAVEIKTKNQNICPYCRKPKVKRLSVGIFECEKCKAKFAGKAYSFDKPKFIEPVVEKAGSRKRRKYTQDEDENSEETINEKEIIAENQKITKKKSVKLSDYEDTIDDSEDSEDQKESDDNEIIED